MVTIAEFHCIISNPILFADDALSLLPLLELHLDVEAHLRGGRKVAGLHEEVRVADAGDDGREPEQERDAGQHVEGDDEHDGELVRALVAEKFRALEAGFELPSETCERADVRGRGRTRTALTSSSKSGWTEKTWEVALTFQKTTNRMKMYMTVRTMERPGCALGS